jgi:ketosteroid isomerase-like protein
LAPPSSTDSTAKYAFPPHHSILQKCVNELPRNPRIILTDSVPSDTKTIKPLFKSYESALHNSSTTEVLPLYAPRGIFMAQHFPTAAGTSAIKAAYNKVFEMVVLAPSFPVHEIEIFNEEWAFVRTSSAGSTEVKATGKMVKEANQELFVLQKIDGEWKIARYCFCTVLPPGEA